MQQTGNYREIHTWMGFGVQTGYQVGKRGNVLPDPLTAADPIPAWLSPVAGDDPTGGGPVVTADARVRYFEVTPRSVRTLSVVVLYAHFFVAGQHGGLSALHPVGVDAFSFSSTVHRCCESDPHRNLAAACRRRYSWSYARTEAQVYLDASSPIFAV